MFNNVEYVCTFALSSDILMKMMKYSWGLTVLKCTAHGANWRFQQLFDQLQDHGFVSADRAREAGRSFWYFLASFLLLLGLQTPWKARTTLRVALKTIQGLIVAYCSLFRIKTAASRWHDVFDFCQVSWI